MVEPLETPPVEMTPPEQGDVVNEGVDISLAGAEPELPGLPTTTEWGEME